MNYLNLQILRIKIKGHTNALLPINLKLILQNLY